jgi:hypothetical protein
VRAEAAGTYVGHGKQPLHPRSKAKRGGEAGVTAVFQLLGWQGCGTAAVGGSCVVGTFFRVGFTWLVCRAVRFAELHSAGAPCFAVLALS